MRFWHTILNFNIAMYNWGWPALIKIKTSSELNISGESNDRNEVRSSTYLNNSSVMSSVSIAWASLAFSTCLTLKIRLFLSVEFKHEGLYAISIRNKPKDRGKKGVCRATLFMNTCQT